MKVNFQITRTYHNPTHGSFQEFSLWIPMGEGFNCLYLAREILMPLVPFKDEPSTNGLIMGFKLMVVDYSGKQVIWEWTSEDRYRV